MSSSSCPLWMNRHRGPRRGPDCRVRSETESVRRELLEGLCERKVRLDRLRSVLSVMGERRKKGRRAQHPARRFRDTHDGEKKNSLA